MKSGNSSLKILIALGVSGVFCLSFAAGHAADIRQVSPTKGTTTLKPMQSAPIAVAPSVQSVTPKNPSITVGGKPLTVTLVGSNLNLITSVQILLNSKIVSNVAAQLGAAAVTSQGTSPAGDMESKADLAKRSSDVTDRLGKRLPDSRPSGTVMIDTVPLPEKPASGLAGSRPSYQQVTLTAQSGAPAGNYQVRIIAGSQTINLSTDVLTVVVKAPVRRAPAASGKQTMTPSRIQSSPKALSPSAGSSGSGDGVAGMSPPPSQLGTLKQPSGSAGQQDGVPVQGSGAGSGNLTEIRGAAASNPSAPTDKASGRSVPSLTTPAGVPSRQLASSQASKVPNMSPSVNLGPREYQPTVNRVAVSPEDVRALRQAGTIGSWQFNWVISKVFSAARFDANSCGGSYKDRKIITSIPNTLFEEAVGAIGRLDYELTGGERDRSRWDVDGREHYRKHIRACVDEWNGRTWAGAVKSGRFLVRIAFQSSTRFVTTRALDGGRRYGDWDWNDAAARSVIPDYWFNGLALEVLLTPRMDGDLISYSDVDARWTFVGGDTFSMNGRFRLAANRPRIINYKDEAMESIRGKIISVFRTPAVRKRIAESITANVTANQFVNSVTSLTGGSESITYEYE